jgi:hypothetical protein
VSLQRLVLSFAGEGIEIRALYRTKRGPNPATKARQREVRELASDGLTRALETLEGVAECLGTSGFTTREDVLLASAPRNTEKPVK